MSTSHPIYLYLHDALVDEVWTSVTREGITQEQVKEVGGKLGVKAKFGFGQLFKHLIADLSAEAVGEGHITRSRTLSYPVSFRALLLSELIAADSNATEPSADFPFGTFVDLKCNFCRLVQIPTLADHLRFQALVSVATQRADRDLDDSTLNALMADFEKITVLKKAFAYHWLQIGDDGQENPIAPLLRELNDEITNAMAVSQDDQILLISSPKGVPRIAVVAFLDEKYLRRDLAGCTGARDINVFGKIAARREASMGGEFVTIQPITITLS